MPVRVRVRVAPVPVVPVVRVRVVPVDRVELPAVPAVPAVHAPQRVPAAPLVRTCQVGRVAATLRANRFRAPACARVVPVVLEVLEDPAAVRVVRAAAVRVVVDRVAVVVVRPAPSVSPRASAVVPLRSSPPRR